jgi:hypothetical protein
MAQTGRRRPVLYLSYLVCYPLWLVSAGLGLLDVVILRRAVEQGYVALGLDKWGMAAASHSATIALGVAWLALVAWTEPAYREGAKDGKLWRRFATVTLWLMVPLALPLWELVVR